MKKILMSIITIAITIITIGFMYVFINGVGNKETLIPNTLSKKEGVESKQEESKKSKDNENKKAKDNENKKETKENSNKTSEGEFIKKVENNKEMLRPSNENNTSEIQRQKSSNVFKVNKHTLLQNLPMKDKIKLLYMCRSLSTIDIGNIKEYMKSSNETEASAEIFKILRQRLSKEDYDKIKSILDSYVNIEYIESNI